jgi:hypothetical protein
MPYIVHFTSYAGVECVLAPEGPDSKTRGCRTGRVSFVPDRKEACAPPFVLEVVVMIIDALIDDPHDRPRTV